MVGGAGFWRVRVVVRQAWREAGIQAYGAKGWGYLVSQRGCIEPRVLQALCVRWIEHRVEEGWP